MMDDVLELTKKSVEINPNNQRFLWRARRLELYIAQRLEEYKKGILGKKAESVRRVMEKDNYKRLVKSFAFATLHHNKPRTIIAIAFFMIPKSYTIINVESVRESVGVFL